MLDQSLCLVLVSSGLVSVPVLRFFAKALMKSVVHEAEVEEQTTVIDNSLMYLGQQNFGDLHANSWNVLVSLGFSWCVNANIFRH